MDNFSEPRRSDDTEPDVKEEMEARVTVPAPPTEGVVPVAPTFPAARRHRLQRGRSRMKELKDRFRAEFSTAWRRILPRRRSAAA